MPTYRMRRSKQRVLVWQEVEADNEAHAAELARLNAVSDAMQSEWFADHDAYDRTREREPETPERDDEREQMGYEL
jgi:hypothetical protein